MRLPDRIQWPGRRVSAEREDLQRVRLPQSTNTTPLDVNKFDQIVGVYADGANKIHGFLLSHPSDHARWQSIDDPNGVGTTTINGINNNADLVGFYVDGAGNTDGFLANSK